MNTPRPVSASRILLVDDYPDSAQSMALLFGVWGYRTLVALDGITGLEMALTQRPDAIFLEVRLPGMHGHEVARRIRAEPNMKNTPLVALTSCGRASDRQASLAAGFDRHLVKPVDLEELHHLLSELVKAPPSTLSPSPSASRAWVNGSVVTPRRVVQEEYEWADLSLRGDALGASR